MDSFEDDFIEQNFVFKNFSEEFSQCLETSEEECKTPIELTYSELTSVQLSKNSSYSVTIGISSAFKKVVLKRIQKVLLQTEFDIQQAKDGYEARKRLVNSNIVKILDYQENDEEFLIVTEFQNQANYFKKKIIQQSSPINNELKIKSYISDITEALVYIHSMGYVHCDIRVENFYCAKSELDILRTVSLANFALIQKRGTLLTSTLKIKLEEKHQYLPKDFEIGGTIDQQFDIFCLGVALYKLCVAYSPNIVVNSPSYYGKIPLRKSDWCEKDQNLVRLVKSMINPDPNQRPTCQQILDHPWLQL